MILLMRMARENIRKRNSKSVYFKINVNTSTPKISRRIILSTVLGRVSRGYLLRRTGPGSKANRSRLTPNSQVGRDRKVGECMASIYVYYLG